MKKCSKCGKEYIINPYYDNLPLKNVSLEIKEKLKYIPNCNCLDLEIENSLNESDVDFKKNSMEKKINKYKELSIIESKFLKSTFDVADKNEKSIESAYKYATAFIENNGSKLGLIFFGPPGTGKTFATACISNYLMEHGKTVLVYSLDLYLSKIKACFGDTEEELLKLVNSCDLLVLDDFGGDSPLSKWALSKVFNLIDLRYRNEKPIIISTNLKFCADDKKCELFEKFKSKNICGIKDRIREMCYPIELIGKSRRVLPRKKKDMGKEKLWKMKCLFLI